MELRKDGVGCRNCGAPVEGERCGYCKTEYGVKGWVGGGSGLGVGTLLAQADARHWGSREKGEGVAGGGDEAVRLAKCLIRRARWRGLARWLVYG